VDRPFVNRLGIRPARRPSIRDIQRLICERHQLTMTELLGAMHSRYIAWPRQEAYWLCAKETGASLPQIGRAFGDRDHTTVLHGIRQHKKRMGETNGAA
jgi:chromosomal replication initiator protein